MADIGVYVGCSCARAAMILTFSCKKAASKLHAAFCTLLLRQPMVIHAGRTNKILQGYDELASANKQNPQPHAVGDLHGGGEGIRTPVRR